MSRKNLRKPYNRTRIQTPGGGDLITDQSQGNDTDVNRIVARFARTGELPAGEPGQFADVTGLQGETTELLERGRAAAEELNQEKQKRDAASREQYEKDKQELEQLRQQQKQSAPEGGDQPSE